MPDPSTHPPLVAADADGAEAAMLYERQQGAITTATLALQQLFDDPDWRQSVQAERHRRAVETIIAAYLERMRDSEPGRPLDPARIV